MEKEIKKIIASFKQLPYLFIGTGFSMRYANALSWDELLFETWKYTYNDDNEYNYKRYKRAIEQANKNTIELDANAYLPLVAEKLQDDFNENYFEVENFSTKLFDKKENLRIIEEELDPYKFFVSKLLSPIKCVRDKQECMEIQHLIINKNKFGGIITTNYDTLLEEVFPDYSVKVGQDSLLLSSIVSLDIYKIHGSAKDPNSIVITQNDYKKFDEKLKYLSAKLLTIFVEHPIIFVGYGLKDPNILKLLDEISTCLSSEQLEKTRNNFIILTPSFGREETVITHKIGNIEMTECVLNDYSMFYKGLNSVPCALPIKVMRVLKNMVTEFVYSSEVKNKVIVGDIGNSTIEDTDLAVYVGKADTVSQIGFDYFEITDICEDVLLDNKPYLIRESLITKTFKNIRSTSGATYLPVYKYLYKLNLPLSKIDPKYKIVKSYSDASANTTIKAYVKSCKNKNFNSIKEICNRYPHHVYKQLALIYHNIEEIDCVDLKQYLVNLFLGEKETFEKHISDFKKLTAIYDYKKYYKKVKKA